jgi:hypothetical protein
MEVVLEARSNGAVALERRNEDDGAGEEEEAIYRGNL